MSISFVVQPNPIAWVTGNRTDGRIAITALALTGAPLNALVDGTFSNRVHFTDSMAVGSIIIFEFDKPQVITATRIYFSDTTSQGIWQWYGSNDSITWTAFSTFTLGGVTTQNDISLSTNRSFYRYYCLQLVSGTTHVSTYLQQIEFFQFASLPGVARTGYPSPSNLVTIVTDTTWERNAPSLCTLPNGHLLMLNARATADGAMGGVTEQRVSTDGGATWSAPTVIYDLGPTMSVGDTGVVLLANGTLLRTWFEYSATIDNSYYSIGTISGDVITWGSPVALPMPSGYNQNCTTGAPLILANGTILLPMYCFLIGDNVYSDVFMTIGSSDGTSWGTPIKITSGGSTAWTETAVWQFTTGKIIAMTRVANRYYYESHSTDNGATWSALVVKIDNGNTNGGAGRPTLIGNPATDGLFMYCRKVSYTSGTPANNISNVYGYCSDLSGNFNTLIDCNITDWHYGAYSSVTPYANGTGFTAVVSFSPTAGGYNAIYKQDFVW